MNISFYEDITLVTPGGRGSRVVVARLKRKAVLVAELHTVLLHMHTVKSVPILQPPTKSIYFINK